MNYALRKYFCFLEVVELELFETCEQHTKETIEEQADFDRQHSKHCKEYKGWGYV
ncbi:hypothetical protein [Brevibacillus laterosporus]|uniref:hypothetical protein n=1 Tax=Brevibacillus laterosporus TaxID=1465 RepID=UPI0018CFD69A|nr:hypothetical protein [Brevibacillus laterosporus]